MKYNTSTTHHLGFQNIQQISSVYPQPVYSTPSLHPQNLSSGYHPPVQSLASNSTSTTSSSVAGGSSSTPHPHIASLQRNSAPAMPSPPSGAPSPGLGILTSSNIPASLANFQIDPQTGMPLSIINSQSCAMLKSSSIVANSSSHCTVSESFENLNNPSGMLLTSRDPVLSAVPLISESSTPNTSSQPLTVNVSSTPAMSISSTPLLSPSLMSSGLLSPSRQYSLLSPSELKNSCQLGSGLSGLGSLKVSLLLEPGALPQPPDPPSPPCPAEKLSPPTPSICVSIFI